MTRRVLVADDNPTLLQLVTEILERGGYSVIEARDGREAFRILRSDCDFVAAIFDADMPHLAGSYLANHMRTEKRLMRIPVMIMSSGQGSLQKSREQSSGAAISSRSHSQPTNCASCLRCSNVTGWRPRNAAPRKCGKLPALLRLAVQSCCSL